MTVADSNERREGSLFEQHAQSVMVLLVVGLLGWVGYTTQILDRKVSVMAVEISTLKDNRDLYYLGQQVQERARVQAEIGKRLRALELRCKP